MFKQHKNSNLQFFAILGVCFKESLDKLLLLSHKSSIKMVVPNSYELAGYRVLKRHLIPIAIVVPSIFECMRKG